MSFLDAQCEITFAQSHGYNDDLWLICLQPRYKRQYKDADLAMWMCSLEDGHKGPHIAIEDHDPDSDRVVAIWPDEIDLVYDPFCVTR